MADIWVLDIHIYRCMCMYIYIYIYLFFYLFIYLHTYIYIYRCVCIYICAYIIIYIYIHVYHDIKYFTSTPTPKRLLSPRVLLDANGHRHEADVKAETAKPGSGPRHSGKLRLMI